MPLSRKKQKAATSRMGLAAAIAVIAVAIVIGVTTWSNRQTQEAAGKHDGAIGSKGPETAKVVITEYGDYQ